MRLLIFVSMALAIFTVGCDYHHDHNSPYHGPHLYVDDYWWINHGHDKWSVAGSVRNDGGAYAHALGVEVTIYDNDGYVWARQYDYIEPPFIDPGGTGTFEVYMDYVPPEFWDLDISIDYE
jgi:hypothetical protein